MHASSLENMEKCYDRYVAGSKLELKERLVVLDIGGADVNGSYSDVFNGQNVEYLGADISPGEGVSIVLEDPNTLPLEDNSIDIIVSGQMLEHCPFFWLVFSEMVRVLSKDGIIFLIAPSSGPIHKYPVDCYRFYPDSFKALAQYTNCFLVDCWLDSRGPWNDLVGVFGKSEKIEKNDCCGKSHSEVVKKINPGAEQRFKEGGKIQGSFGYIEALKLIHARLKPDNYLEIGVRKGGSLSLSTCVSVGVDPHPCVEVELSSKVRVVQETSDCFFESAKDPILQEKLNLVFIDGMHLFEYALRDFMNVELYSDSDTVVVIDDVFPNDPEQASRERRTKVWTGDVWKLIYLLQEYRKDLKILLLDVSPTGMALITGLNAKNRTLWSLYNPIIRRLRSMPDVPPEEVMNRKFSCSPLSRDFDAFLN